MEVFSILVEINGYKNELRELITQYVNGYLSIDESLSVCRTLKLVLITSDTQEDVCCWTTINQESIMADIEQVIAQSGVAQKDSELFASPKHEDEGDLTLTTKHIARCIETLTVRLPSSSYVDILWVSNDGYPPLREHLSLFGTFRGILDSIPSLLSLVLECDNEGDDKNGYSDWLTHLYSRVIGYEEVAAIGRGLVWQGSVKIPDMHSNSSLILNGFTLQSHAAATFLFSPESKSSVTLATSMEFITEVAVHSIPAIYQTSHKLQLIIRSPSPLLDESRELLASLDEPDLGYIVRLARYGTSSSKLVDYAYFLFKVRPSEDNAGQCSVHVLRNPKYLNPEVVRLLAEAPQEWLHNDTYFTPEKRELLDAFQGQLPYIDGDFAMLQTQPDIVQAQTVHKFTDLPSTPLNNVKNVKIGKTKVYMPRGTESMEMITLLPEYMAHWTSSLERAALVARAENDRALRRRQSEECTIGGLAPPAAKMTGHLKLNLEELLSYFQADGSAVAPDLEPVRGRRTSDAHDIYYHPPEHVDEKEKSRDKLKMKLLSVETQSTCMHSHAKAAAVIVLPIKANIQIRSSPRVKSSCKTKLNMRLTPSKRRGVVSSALTPRSRRAANLKGHGQLAVRSSPRKQTAILTHQKVSFTHAQTVLFQNDKVTPSKVKPGKLTMGTTAEIAGKITPSKCKPGKPKINTKEIAGKITPSKLKHGKPRVITTVDMKPPVCKAQQNQHASVEAHPLATVSRVEVKSTSTTVVRDFKATKAAQLSESDRLVRLSRSQRHKQKLEEVVAKSLSKQGVRKSDTLFTACSRRLYTLVKVFVKDLPTSHNLRQEMTRLAEQHVRHCVEFERTRAKK